MSNNKTVLRGKYIDDELVVWNENNQFDATPEGAQLVFAEFNGVPGDHSFEQFSSLLHVPQLVEHVLAGSEVPTPPNLPLPPKLNVEFLQETDNVRVSMNITGHVESIGVWQDGLLSEEIALPAGKSRLDHNIALFAGTRTLAITARSAEGAISIPQVYFIRERVVGKRKVHILSVGVDEYNNIPDLAAARADAQRFERTIRDATLNNGGSIGEIVLLVEGQVTSSDVLEAAEKIIEKAETGDTIAVFFAGHGIQDSDSGEYLLAMTGTRREDLVGSSLRWIDLSMILRRSPTRVAVFIDSCHSGEAGAQFFATNDDATEQLLTGVPSGLVVFAAAKGREFSFEDHKREGGFFTLALSDVLVGQKEAHDLNRSGSIELNELLSGVRRKVIAESLETRKEETERLGLDQLLTQVPWLARNGMVGDFALF